jgi:hypothetical protein
VSFHIGVGASYIALWCRESSKENCNPVATAPGSDLIGREDPSDESLGYFRSSALRTWLNPMRVRGLATGRATAPNTHVLSSNPGQLLNSFDLVDHGL